MEASYSIIVTGSSALGPSFVSGVSPGMNASMSVMWPMRSGFHRGATRIPVDMASIEPASTACMIAVSAPSSLTRANAKGWSSGCCAVGLATQDHDCTVPAGPTSTKSWASCAPVCRIPLQRRHDHPLAAADPNDLLFGQTPS